MPYIKQEDREALNNHDDEPQNAGELNYMITVMIQEYLGSKPNYQRFNETIGVLECAKLELYRRMVAPYEDKKIEENGDVYIEAA